MSLPNRTQSAALIARAALGLLLCSLGAPVARAQRLNTPETPRVELFGGYAYLYPHAILSGLQSGGTLPLVTCLCGEVRGGGASFTYNFAPWFGLTADISGSSSGSGNQPSSAGKADFFAFSGGPKITYRSRHFSPFIEALIGEQRLSPTLFAPSSNFGVLAGGGIDLPLKKHFGVRLVRADYVFSNQQFGPSSVPGTHIRGLRLESGVVFSFGFREHKPSLASPMPAPQPIAAALPSPAPNVAPVMQPLTLSLAAIPPVVMAGQSSTITAKSAAAGVMTYNFQTSAGVIVGSGSTANLTTAGLAAGPIEIIGTVTDEQGRSVSASTSVVVEGLAIAAPVTTSNAGTISFARYLRLPVRVDNEGKAKLDDIALNLQRDFNTQLALIGNAAVNERDRTHVAALRAVDTKAYLVHDKGIDPSRIILYTGTADSRTVDVIVIPLGAKLDTSANEPIDERNVKAQPRRSLRQRAGE